MLSPALYYSLALIALFDATFSITFKLLVLLVVNFGVQSMQNTGIGNIHIS